MFSLVFFIQLSHGGAKQCSIPVSFTIMALIVELAGANSWACSILSAKSGWTLQLQIQNIPLLQGLRAVPITAKCSERLPDL